MLSIFDLPLLGVQLPGVQGTLTWLIPLAAFVAIAAGTWSVLEMMHGQKRKEDRLDQFSQDLKKLARENSDQKEPRSSAVLGFLHLAASKLSKHLEPKNQKDAGKLKAKLQQAGFRHAEAKTIFLGSKILGLMVGGLIGGAVFLLIGGATTSTLIRCGITSGMFFYLPDAFLWWKTRRRKEQIFLGLPDVLDLLVVCVEAGLGLDQAMRKVSEEMQASFPVLSDELGLCNVQLQMGRTRAEVLTELGQRTGVEDLRSLATIILQADKFGSSIAQALRVQSESMRTRRRQLAEEKAAKTAVQLIFPLVLFIFPAVFVVLVGPAAITFVNEMMPIMNAAQQ